MEQNKNLGAPQLLVVRRRVKILVMLEKEKPDNGCLGKTLSIFVSDLSGATTLF